MRTGIGLSALLFAMILPMTGHAADRNDVPSCYAYTHMEANRPASSGRELDVLIDQTTALSDDLRSTALNAVMRFVHPGDEIALYAFSAFLADDYTHLSFRGLLEPIIPEQARGSIGMESMRQLDRCLQQQQQFFVKTFSSRFNQTMGSQTKNIAKSDILFNLQQISASWTQQPVRQRIVLVISDMLENSNFSSFYVRNGVRHIDPDRELAKAEKAHLFGDFAGARIYVHGAGLIAPTTRNTYRSGVEIEALEQFWSGYFRRSQATLAGFGAPALTVDLQ